MTTESTTLDGLMHELADICCWLAGNALGAAAIANDQPMKARLSQLGAEVLEVAHALLPPKRASLSKLDVARAVTRLGGAGQVAASTALDYLRSVERIEDAHAVAARAARLAVVMAGIRAALAAEVAI